MLRDQLFQMVTAGSDQEHIRSLVLAYIASLNSKDVEARLALFAPNATVEDPVGSKAVVGHDALRALWTASTGLGVKATLKRIVVCASEACYEFEAELDAGEGGRARILCISTIKVGPAGLIAEMRAYFDRACIS